MENQKMASLAAARLVKKKIHDDVEAIRKAIAGICGIGIEGNRNIGYGVTIRINAEPPDMFPDQIGDVPITVKIVDRPKKMKSANKNKK